MERKLTAILCADVHGYSRLMSGDEEGTFRTLASHRKTIDDLIEQHQGHFVSSVGDSVLAEFASVVKAVECSVEIQSKLKLENANLPPERRMEFRIGINLGDVIVDGEQIYGDGVNVAARLESLAEPGGICISGTAYEQVRDKLTFGYEDCGEQNVKNIPRPVHVWRMRLDGTREVGSGPRVRQRKYWRGGVLSISGLAFIVAAILLAQNLSLKPTKMFASIPSPEKPALPLPSIPSIAVLPFTNLSGDPSQEYFSDGLTDNLITVLSKIPGVFVIARNSSFSYKGKPISIEQVGRELGVRMIVQGSVLKAGERIRVNAQLSDAASGANLWAQDFDQPLKDIFIVQDAIVHHLVTVLSAQFKLSARKIPRGVLFTDIVNCNVEAMDAMWQGAPYFWELTREGNEKARRMDQKAIALDPNCANAYAALGWTYSIDVMYQRSANPSADFARSAKLAQKALSMDDSNTLALSLVSRNDLLERRPDQAITDAKRILALDPNSVMGYYNLATALNADSRPQGAIPAIRQAMRLDPGSDLYSNVLGDAYLRLGRYNEAVVHIKRYAANYPNDLGPHLDLAIAYTELGRDQDARAEAAEVLRLSPRFEVPPRENWWGKDKVLADRQLADLRKAGLK